MRDLRLAEEAVLAGISTGRAKAAKSAVPESVLKKRKRQEKWDEENRAKAAAAATAGTAKKAEAFKRAEQYVKEYFATVVEHYEIGGAHFEGTKGYEFYGNAAEAIKAMGLEAMAEMYAGLNTYGTPEQVIEQLKAQKEILGCDHDVLVIPKYGSMTQAEAESSIALFANDVMPAFRPAA